MNIILETERLFLREIDVSDAKDMFELNSDEEVMRYTGDVMFNSVEQSRQFIADYPDYKKNGFGRNAVILKNTGEFLGWCGLKKLKDGTVDIGYRFFKRNWNKGYATESSKAMVNFGFKNYGLSEIVGNASIQNPASIRVFEKLGMSFQKKAPCDGIEDAVQYILKNELSR